MNTEATSPLQAIADPAENTQMLTEQLRALGLYAAPTLGDGNCLFRALSDQLYGTESYHSKLRTEVCNWIEAYKRRYEPFVDDERGLDVHLQCMRQQGEPPVKLLDTKIQMLICILRNLRRSPRALRVCTYDQTECQGCPARACLHYRMERRRRIL